jgi:hypothetical protein
MARRKDHGRHLTSAVGELLGSVTNLLVKVGEAVRDSAEVHAAAGRVQRAGTETGRKIGSKVRAAWARLTPAQRKARIAKMHAWRKKKAKPAK